MFKVKKVLNKDVYYSSLLEDIPHFFTSRELIVKDNINSLGQYFNIKPENLKHPTQVHSANIDIASEDKNTYNEVDALILKDKNLAIYLNFADCTPVILYDTRNNIGAIAHAGWRGTAQRIAPKTFLKMKELFNSKASDIIALIGPCISFQCFETSSEAIFELKKSVNDPHGLFKENYADLKGINERQLKEAGVSQIDVCPYCTVLDNDKFFSYRKENKTTKRHSAVLKLPD